MTTVLKLNLLGGFSLSTSDGSSVHLPAGKSQALLAYLALNPNDAHPRGKLAALLWGDQDETHARGNLSQCLFRLRKALGDEADDILDAGKDSVRLNGELVAVDALNMRQLANSDAVEAAKHCTGPLFDAFTTRQEAFEEWLTQERETYTRLMESVLQAAAETQLESKESERAIEAAQRLLVMNALNEEAHRLLMRAYLAAGKRHAVLQQYRACEEVLRRELDVAPDAATAALHDEIQGQANQSPSELNAFTRATPRPSESAVADEFDDNGRASHSARRMSWRKIAVVFFAIVAVTVAGAWLWQQPFGNGSVKVAKSSRPSIAVLPFANLSDDKNQEYFADGMTDDLISDLSKVSGLSVVARTSSFVYKGKNVSMPKIASALDVKFLLEGSVRRAGDQVRINAQLIDGTTGTHLWAETFDRSYRNVFKLQDDVTSKIIKALKVTLTTQEVAVLSRPPTNNLEAYDYFLKAEKLRHRPHWKTLGPAFGLYDKAIALDSQFLEAHVGLAWISFRAWRLSWFGAIDPLEAKRRTLAAVDNALNLDPANTDALAIKIDIQTYLLENTRALNFAEKAVRLHPTNPDVLVARANVLVSLGRVDDARNDLARAENLAEKPSRELLRKFYGLRTLLGDYREAVSWALRYRGESSPGTETISLAASYAGLGEMNKAKVEMANTKKRWSWMSLAWMRVSRLHYRDERMLDRFLELLEKAGMPRFPHGFKGDLALRLRKSRLEKLFFSERVVWKSTNYLKYKNSMHIDGKGNFSTTTQTRAGKTIQVNGTHSIRADMFCFHSESVQMGREHCYEIYRNPAGSVAKRNQYFRVGIFRKKYFSIERVKSN
jgi:adenylate cyclase